MTNFYLSFNCLHAHVTVQYVSVNWNLTVEFEDLIFLLIPLAAPNKSLAQLAFQKVLELDDGELLEPGVMDSIQFHTCDSKLSLSCCLCEEESQCTLFVSNSFLPQERILLSLHFLLSVIPETT